MLELLEPTLFINILENLDCYSLRQLSRTSKSIRNDYKDYIYYRHAKENKLLSSLDFFLKNEFIVPTFSSAPLNNLFQYISTQSSLFIAGGFPTQLYMDKTPRVTSDIDIYVLGGIRHKYVPHDTNFKKHDLLDVYNLLEFIYRNYSNIYVTKVGTNVYTITVNEFPHPIQIILTTYWSPAEVLSSFDNSHNRCGIYLNNTYIGIDTKLGYATKTTYFYTPAKPSRYVKAILLGFNIFGFNHEELIRLQYLAAIQTEYNVNAVTRSTPELILNKLVEHGYPSRNWKISYNNREKTIDCFESVDIDMTKTLSKQAKLALYNGCGVRNYPHLSTMIEPNIVLKSPNSAFLKIIKPVIHRYRYTIIGEMIYTNSTCYILVTDRNELEKLKIIKQNMLEIFRNYHKLSKVPDNIQNCRTLTNWNQFIKYRKDIGEPIDRNMVKSIFKIGFEYDDCMRTYNNYSYIKGFHSRLLNILPGHYKFEIDTKPIMIEYTNTDTIYSGIYPLPFSWGFYSNQINNFTPLN